MAKRISPKLSDDIPNKKAKRQRGLRIRYNAPVTLTFTFMAAAVLVLSYFLPGLLLNFFSTPAPFTGKTFMEYVRLMSYPLGHAGLDHFFNNFGFILLLGPILEASYGSRSLLLMMVITAIVTGLLNVFFFPTTTLLGASGIVFMMILLASFTNFRRGEIPLTFILILVVYLGREVFTALTAKDQVSQFAHIFGGLIGSIFGFINQPKTAEANSGKESYPL